MEASLSEPVATAFKVHFSGTPELAGPASALAGGGYINMMMVEGNDNVKASYRDNYGRLAEIKRKYDPANLFRVNQNIRPA